MGATRLTAFWQADVSAKVWLIYANGECAGTAASENATPDRDDRDKPNGRQP